VSWVIKQRTLATNMTLQYVLVRIDVKLDEHKTNKNEAGNAKFWNFKKKNAHLSSRF
jgi:hypothetical protein